MDKFPSMRKRCCTKNIWSLGYCFTTVGLDEEMIQKYVRWQGKRGKDYDDNG